MLAVTKTPSADARVALVGELGGADCVELGSVLAGLVADGVQQLTIDLHDVSFIDVACLGMIADMASQVRTVEVCGASATNRRVLEILGLRIERAGRPGESA